MLRARRLARATARRVQRSYERSELEKAGSIQPGALHEKLSTFVGSFSCLVIAEGGFEQAEMRVHRHE